MRFTKARFEALEAAAREEDYPGSDGVRRGLEKHGAIAWYGGLPSLNRFGRAPDAKCFGENYLFWRITAKGRSILEEWRKIHSA